MIRPITRRTAAALGLVSVLACAGGGGEAGSSGNPPESSVGSTRYFPDAAVWYRDVSTAALDPQSAAVIAYLDRAGWGLGRMQIDFSIEVLTADASAPLRPFTPTDDHFSPDCDLDPVPVPAGGDCHVRLSFTPSSPGPVSATLTVSESGFQAISVTSTVRGSGGEPMLRTNPKGQPGQFRRISWDEAFTYIAGKLAAIRDKWGPEAVAYTCHHDPNTVFFEQ